MAKTVDDMTAGASDDGASDARSARRAKGSNGTNGKSGMQRHARIIDLIPRRNIAFFLTLLLGLGVIAGLEALYHYMPQLAKGASDGRIAAFDLDGEGSLSVWFTSTTLFMASCVAMIIYSVRRQKADDYHGRYRWWLVVAACWMVMSIDESGSLHEGFKELMTRVTGARIAGDGSLWWAIPYTAALGVVGIRAILDMRGCKSSIAVLLATAASYAVAVVTQLGWIMPETGARGVMLEEGCEMGGALLLFLSMGLHARHVILDAEGLLPERKAKVKKKKSAPVSDDLGKKTSDKPAPKPAVAAAAAARAEKPQPATARSGAPTLSPSASKPLGAMIADRKNGQTTRIDPPQKHGQTRAERKALRRAAKAARRDDDYDDED